MNTNDRYYLNSPFVICSHSKTMPSVAVAIVLAILGGCATAPRPGLAPVEDRSAKVAPRVPTASTSAKTAPLPTIIEEAPLRAEPLAPWAGVNAEVTRPATPPRLPTPITPTPITPTVASPITVPASPTVSAPPPPKAQPEIQAPHAQKPADSSANTGVVALLGKADDQAAAGQLGSAAVTLERALRIEPENGRLWHELAGIRLKQGQLDAAISMAEKSNSLARSQRNLQASNWRLIAVARQKQGQSQTAAEALLRARSFETQ